MKVLLIHQFFYPEVAAVAQLMTDLVEDLVNNGIEVSVLCGKATYEQSSNQATEATKRYLSQASIYRVPAIRKKTESSIVHFFSYFVFHVLAFWRALAIPSPDCVVTFTNPPLIAFLGWVLKLFKGARFIYVVEDVYPDVAVELGFLRPESLITRFLSRLSTSILKKADVVIAIGDIMRERLLQKGAASSRIQVIHNWADGKSIFPVDPQENWFIKEYGFEGNFVVQYSGHIGEGHYFRALLGTARELQENDDIKFVFIGDGRRKKEIVEYRNRYRLKSVFILPYQDRSQLRYTLGAASVAIATLHSKLEGLMVPSKIYGIMASAKPVIFIGSSEGEIARIIGEANCGFCISPEATEELKALVLSLYDDPSLVKRLGENAREYFETHFERVEQTSKYIRLIAGDSNAPSKIVPPRVRGSTHEEEQVYRGAGGTDTY